MATSDDRKRDASFWAGRLDRLAASLSKPAVAIARQRLPQWCAMSGGLTRDELWAHLAEVESVLAQAGVRQGLIRRGPGQSPDDSSRPRPRLRVIK
jgi:hypothetical protein